MENQPHDPQPAGRTGTPPPPESGPAPGPGDRRNVRPARRRWRLIAFIVLPLLVIGGALYYWFFMRPYESTDDAFIEADVATIAPRVPGQVTKLLIRDNKLVRHGDLLIEIDPRDYETRLAQAQAGLAQARARLEQAKAQMAADEAKAAQERANIVAVEAEAARALADLKRYQSLQSPAVSRSQLDLASTQARANEANVQVAHSRAQAAEAQVALSRAAIETAAADVQRSEAVVRQAQLDLSYTKVTALGDGFVTHRSVEVGNYVQTGQALLALVPFQVWVLANFKETQLAHMRPGQPVTVHVDAYPQHTFRAHVDSIQRGSGARFSLLPPENATGNYVKVVQRVPVKILFDEPPDPNLPLGPGMSVEPKVRVLEKGRPRANNVVKR